MALCFSRSGFRCGLALALAGACIGFSASVGLGDEIILRDGTVYTGTVVSNTRREVVIDTTIHGISTRLTLDQREVRSVVIGSTPTTPAQAPGEGAGATPLTPGVSAEVTGVEAEGVKILKREGHDLVLEVPMSGTFGQDIYPLSIYETLAWAEEQGVTDIVFRMNSGGGEVWAAMGIVEIMDQFAGKFRYHALIEHAISATIWPAFNCETITMTPGATFGGAVAYTMNETGSAEVDKKMNSIWAAKLAASAQSKGHSPHLVKAMIVSDNAVYAVRRGGEWVLTDETPAESDYKTIDGPDSILTLTADQAGEYGIATFVNDRSIESFTEVQDIVDWDSAGEKGNELAAEANETCNDLRKELIGVLASFTREQEISNNRESLRGYASAVQSMRRLLGRYKSLIRQSEDLKMKAIIDSLENRIDIKFWENEIDIRMREIRNSVRG